MLIRLPLNVVIGALLLGGLGGGPTVAAEPGVKDCEFPTQLTVEGECVAVSAETTALVTGDSAPKGSGAPVCRQADENSNLPLCHFDPYGDWNQTRQCWTKRTNPQPGFDFVIWEGRTHGAIYDCWSNGFRPNVGRGGGAVEMKNWHYWASEGQVDLEALALQAVEEMHLTAPAIGLTGYGKPESLQLLGLPTWMWAADPGDSTTGPITRYASAGAVTVTATGRLTATVWQMGDGSVVTCAGPNAAGTPYDASYGGDPSPTCGYQYGRTSAREPGGAFTVTVTANWEIVWSGGGQSGVLTRSVVRSTQLRVGEAQLITDRRG